ncbi:MAG: hypothetical protein K2N64_01600 [Anaeroplasmataceae bacterium]|nr:hypothetical protein [Anaeroplasmataceae bacterium]
MSKHQKRVIITNACVTSGIILTLLGIALMNIFGFCILDKNLSGKLILSAFLLVIIGFILLIIATRKNAKYAIYAGYIRSKFGPPLREYFASAGVPNNAFLEFDISISKHLPEVLHAQEITKGVYEIKVDEKKYTFDMKGWIHKEYYIYEIILAKIQIKFMLKKNIKSLCKSLHISEINNLKIEFLRLNGKKRIYTLVEDSQTKVSQKFKKNMRQKIIYFKNVKKISIKSLYDFNE